MKRFKIHFFSCLVAAVLIPLLLTTAVAQAQVAPWTVVQSPNPLAGGNQLNGVASVSATDIWAVGFFEPSPNFFQTLTLHWDGTSWSVVSSPNPSGSQDFFDAASADPSSGQAWAVGSFIAFNP